MIQHVTDLAIGWGSRRRFIIQQQEGKDSSKTLIRVLIYQRQTLNFWNVIILFTGDNNAIIPTIFQNHQIKMWPL